MAEQKSGMEMMLASLMKAAGFDPKQLEKAIVETVDGFRQMVVALGERLDKIDQKQAVIDARLERIEHALNLHPDKAEAVRAIASHTEN